MTKTPHTTILFDRNLVLQREYWRNQLRDPDCAAGILPDFPRRGVHDSRTGEIPFAPDDSLTARILSLARDNDLLLFTIFTGCCKVLLHSYSEARRIAIGSPARGSGVEANALPIISDIGPELSMREVLKNELEVLREGYKHQQWPYERMLKEAGLGDDPARCRLFDIAIILTNIHGPLADVRNDITISLTRVAGRLAGVLSYRTAIYEKRTIDRFADLFCRTIAWAVEDPGRKVGDLCLITAAEQQTILEELNSTARPFADDVCFHTLFEQQVARSPQATALMTRQRLMSYLELNRRANILARYLLRCGLTRGRIVGICFDRVPEGITAILAVLKAGGVYLPLDPDYPSERLAFMVEDAAVSLILSHRDQADRVRDLDNVTLILTDTIEEEHEEGGDENLDLPVGPDDCAYLIYTSGSSGTPKGALNAHRGLCNLTTAHIEAFEVTPESRVLQFASWSFDAMASELAMSLCSGACLCLCPAESIIPGPPLVEAVNDLRISHITLPPAALQYMDPDEMPTLSHIVTAGDFCPPEQMKRWSSAKVFFNAYGVTEATVCSTIAPVSTDDRVKGVGRPMANTTVYILDGRQKMVPVGFPGELYLGGVGVAKGYLNRPELNADRFMADPFSSRRDARMYRSGDRGRLLEDGSVELLGRIDQQIKIRGFRIEPGEIKHVLEQHPGVRQALVLASREETSLAAFIEAPGERPASSELIAHCMKHLPHFMVPSSWTTVGAFPLNPNGKIDRRALLELARATREQKRGSASPRTALELQLVGIWQEILGMETVGIREDFFELGGHSLLAIRLLALIQQRLSVKMSLAALIEHPTVEKLAAHMRDGASGTIPWSHLVPIQPKGTQRPLFCIHPGGGNVHGYLELSRLLGDDQPLYGVQAIGFECGQEAITDIATMAERYVDAMRGVQPNGPYAIIGWCFGARAALECARKLSDLGERVDYLAFLDAYAPHVIPDSQMKSDDASLWESLLAQDTPISAEELRMYRPEEQVSRVIKLAKDADLIPDYYSDEQARRVMDVFRANSHIVQSPVSAPYSGCLELFKAEEEAGTARLFTADPSLGWRDVVTGPVTVTVVPGNHNTLVRRPHVRILAECIRASLEKSREPNKIGDLEGKTIKCIRTR